MGKKRILVVAGTHYRENEFSHSVADRLISGYGKKEPDHFFEGSDSARQGRLWVYDGIAVAKIDRVGETSLEYLQTLSRDDLVRLADFKLMHEGCEFPPSIDDCFGNINQWTSVSQQLVDASDAGMYIDLHSFHAYSQLDGTGLHILPHAREETVEIMKKSLGTAKREEPKVYGSSEHNPFDDQKETALGIRDDKVEGLSAERERLVSDLGGVLIRLDHSQLINLLRGDVDSQLRDLVSNLGRVNSQLLAYEAQAISKRGERWGDLWYLDDGSLSNDVIDYFTFEAVHWKGRQQAAVVNFITRYLVPIFKRSLHNF